MNRRSLLHTLALVPLALTTSARADEVWVAPPTLGVRLERDTYTSPPTSVALVVTNGTDAPVELQGARLVVVTAGVRVPLSLTRVEIDGVQRSASDVARLAPGASARVTLGFASVPETALATGRIDFALRFVGTSESVFSMRASRGR